MKNWIFSLLILSVLFLTGCSSRIDLSSNLGGIHVPDTYNHTEGKNRILYSIRSTSFAQGDWASANGLLGSSLLDVESIDREGYKFLFLSQLTTAKGKLDASHKNYSTWFTNTEQVPEYSKSIIARRESVIYSLAYQLNYRYTFNDAGNYEKNYKPQNRESNKKLHQVILKGLEVYEELGKKGFDDKTLRDSLCIGFASLEYDGFKLGSEPYGLGSPQVCLDAIKYTLNFLHENRNDDFVSSYDFLYVLGEQMMTRDLIIDDVILIPNLEGDTNLQQILENTNENEIESKLSEYITEKQAPILKIISDDLDNIKKK